MTHPPRTPGQIRRELERTNHWGKRYPASLALIAAAYIGALIAWIIYPPAGPVLMFGVVPTICLALLVAGTVLTRRLARLSAELRATEPSSSRRPA